LKGFEDFISVSVQRIPGKYLDVTKWFNDYYRLISEEIPDFAGIMTVFGAHSGCSYRIDTTVKAGSRFCK
jgi:hypothetical protein